jgi:4-alpha-glucanotransferase
VWDYLNRGDGDSKEIAAELIRVAWSSVAALAIAPLQDLLNLGVEARMNSPGSVDANWCWRSTDDMLNTSVFRELSNLTAHSDRLTVVRGAAATT